MDIQKVWMLIDIATKLAGLPQLSEIRNEVMAQLEKVNADLAKPKEVKVVTPPEGPANSAFQRQDGSLERKPPGQNPAIPRRSEVGIQAASDHRGTFDPGDDEIERRV